MARGLDKRKQTQFDSEALEDLIRTRSFQMFQKHANHWLKSDISMTQFSTILMGYRRLSLFNEGWKVLRQRWQTANDRNLQLEIPTLQLWLAYWLHIMGATELASRALESIELKSEFSYRTKAEIALTRYEFNGASNYFRQYLELQTKPETRQSYDSRLVRLEYADSLCGEGFAFEALQISKAVLAQTNEPLLKSITLSCQCEYWARLEEWDKAIEAGNSALKTHPPADTSIDYYLLHKWYHFAQFKKESRPENLRSLINVYRGMRRMSLRPEAWIDTLKLILLCKMNQRVLDKIGFYPGLDPMFELQFRKAMSVLPKKTEIDPTVNGTSESDLTICWAANDWNYQGHWTYGLSLEIRCLAYLVMAKNWGLYRLKLISMLWPDDHPSTLNSLEQRLEQLLKRIRKKWNFEIYSRRQYLFVGVSDRKRIHIDNTVALRPAIYKDIANPTAKDVAAFYHLSLSRSYEILKLIQEKL